MSRLIALVLFAMISTSSFADSQLTISFYDDLGGSGHAIEFDSLGLPVSFNVSQGMMDASHPFLFEGVVFDVNDPDGVLDYHKFAVFVSPVLGQKYLTLLDISELKMNQLNVCHVLPDNISVIKIQCN